MSAPCWLVDTTSELYHVAHPRSRARDKETRGEQENFQDETVWWVVAVGDRPDTLPLSGWDASGRCADTRNYTSNVEERQGKGKERDKKVCHLHYYGVVLLKQVLARLTSKTQPHRPRLHINAAET